MYYGSWGVMTSFHLLLHPDVDGLVVMEELHRMRTNTETLLPSVIEASIPFAGSYHS